MTDHARAIEAGARAIAPYMHDDYWKVGNRAIAKACIQAAIASGALVPASAVVEMRERCAAIIQAECDRILSKQTPTSDPFSDADAINTNLRMMAVILPDLVEKVRQLDTAPASGDCTHANKFTRTKAGNDLTPENYCPDCDTVLPMLNAASSNGGGK